MVLVGFLLTNPVLLLLIRGGGEGERGGGRKEEEEEENGVSEKKEGLRPPRKKPRCKVEFQDRPGREQHKSKKSENPQSKLSVVECLLKLRGGEKKRLHQQERKN